MSSLLGRDSVSDARASTSAISFRRDRARAYQLHESAARNTASCAAFGGLSKMARRSAEDVLRTDASPRSVPARRHAPVSSRSFCASLQLAVTQAEAHRKIFSRVYMLIYNRSDDGAMNGISSRHYCFRGYSRSPTLNDRQACLATLHALFRVGGRVEVSRTIA